MNQITCYSLFFSLYLLYATCTFLAVDNNKKNLIRSRWSAAFGPTPRSVFPFILSFTSSSPAINLLDFPSLPSRWESSLLSLPFFLPHHLLFQSYSPTASFFPSSSQFLSFFSFSSFPLPILLSVIQILALNMKSDIKVTPTRKQTRTKVACGLRNTSCLQWCAAVRREEQVSFGELRKVIHQLDIGRYDWGNNYNDERRGEQIGRVMKRNTRWETSDSHKE